MLESHNYFLDKIKKLGPVKIANFMGMVLYDPKYGYYMQKKPIGKEGDFITAPEISQIFGELLGLYAAQTWLNLAAPNKFILTEMGPGYGTLMMDMLRATKNIPNFHDSLEIYLCEISPNLRQIQQEKLKLNFPNIYQKINWVNDLSFLNNKSDAMALIANELLDALPIHQFIVKENSWQDVMVEYNGEFNRCNFTYTPCHPKIADKLNFAYADLMQENIVIEESPTANSIIKYVSEYIIKNKGSAVFIDYGYETLPLNSTIQALKKHKYQNIFENLGQCDLTSLVDFNNAKKAVPLPCEANIYSQKDFLISLGIQERTKILLKNANDKQKELLNSGTTRLIGTKENEMGELFKVLTIS